MDIVVDSCQKGHVSKSFSSGESREQKMDESVTVTQSTDYGFGNLDDGCNLITPSKVDKVCLEDVDGLTEGKNHVSSDSGTKNVGIKDEIGEMLAGKLVAGDSGQFESPMHMVDTSTPSGVKNANDVADKKSRPRKESKYLSPPYVDLRKGSRGLCKFKESDDPKTPRSKEERKGRKRPSSQGSTSLPSVECRVIKRDLSKFITASGRLKGIKASSSKLLSELHMAALNCLYPYKSGKFNATEAFFTRYRTAVYRGESKSEVLYPQGEQRKENETKQPLAPDSAVKVPKPKRKYVRRSTTSKHIDPQDEQGKENETKQPLATGSAVKVSKSKRKYVRRSITTSSSQQKKPRKEKPMADSHKKAAAGVHDVSVNAATSSLPPDHQNVGASVELAVKSQRKRKRKEGTSALPEPKHVGNIPDLNGNTALKTSLSEGSQLKGHVTSESQPEKRKRRKKDGSASKGLVNKSTDGFLVTNTINAEPISLEVDLRDVGRQTPPLTAPGADATIVFGGVGANAAVAASGVGVNTGVAAAGLDMNQSAAAGVGVNVEFAASGAGVNPSVVSPGLVMNQAADSGAGLNTVVASPGLGVNQAAASGVGFNAAVSGSVIVNNTAAPGAGLNMNKAPATAVSGVSTAAGDVNEAVAPACFGVSTAIASSGGSVRPNIIPGAREGNRDGTMCDPLSSLPVMSQTAKGGHKPAALKSSPAKPALKPPSLEEIRRNLVLMIQMLDECGDDLSPDCKAKLESDIQGLLKKVGGNVGSSSS